MVDLRGVTLETERLFLRCVEERDASTVSKQMAPPIARWLASWEVPFTIEMAQQRIDKERLAAKAGASLPFAIFEKADGRFVGWVTAYRFRDDPARGGVGYWLTVSAQGKGYMREIAKPVLRASFVYLGVDVVEAGAQIDNDRSLAVMAAWGMKFVGDRTHYAPARRREEICRFYEITRQAFDCAG